jgi:hypothetical protein
MEKVIVSSKLSLSAFELPNFVWRIHTNLFMHSHQRRQLAELANCRIVKFSNFQIFKFSNCKKNPLHLRERDWSWGVLRLFLNDELLDELLMIKKNLYRINAIAHPVDSRNSDRIVSGFYHLSFTNNCFACHV